MMEILHGRQRYLSTQSAKSKHHDAVGLGILADEFHDKHPRKWMNQDLITSEEAKEVYMVEVIAQSHC